MKPVTEGSLAALKPKGRAVPQKPPPWSCGTLRTPGGEVVRVSTRWSRSDYLGRIGCRISGLRMRYSVPPGLYAVGEPDGSSDVFVSANYKLGFDILRRALKGLDAWVLVLDTRGINVWCAAGKGTFGTAELVKRIHEAGLDRVVSHRRLILPQLSAPGVQAHRVKRLTGFRVSYGPVRAGDIPGYADAGYKATREMRTVRFGLLDRLVLTPMEMIPAMKRYPLFALAVLLAFGLRPQGIMFKEALAGGWPFLFMGLLAVMAGALLTPVLLPLVPFRSFALKGLVVGALSVLGAFYFIDVNDAFLQAAAWVFFPAASSYIALQFTGSTAYTGMSGVKRELRFAVPAYLSALGVSVLFLLAYKLTTWGAA